MLRLAIDGFAVAAFITTILIFHSHLRHLRASYRELYQLSIQAGTERYRYTQSLHRQIDALAERCMEHGDSGPDVAEILRSATSLRSP